MNDMPDQSSGAEGQTPAARGAGGEASTRMSILTPSYAGDFELCAELNRSVQAYAPDDVVHHVIVPRRDLDLFARLQGPRTQIHCEADFLPRSFLTVPWLKMWVNARRPFPPVRGWITQQIVKLAAASQVDTDVALLVDSDIQFVRPFSSATFSRNAIVRFYRKPDEIDQRLPRHMIWHRSGRALLGLPPADPPFTDYVAWPVAWDPTLVGMLLKRIEEVNRRPWADVVAAQLHFSEMTLYGLFVDEMLAGPTNSFVSDEMLCLNHCEERPLDAPSLTTFLAGLGPADVAAQISTKSRTPLAVRRSGFAALHAAQQLSDIQPPSIR